MKTSQALNKPQPGLATLVRPRYSPGLLLEDEDLTAGVDYTRELNRLLFRSLFGCGVICGLTVTAAKDCNGRRLVVSIDKGLALDCMGNPIHVTAPQTVTYDPDCAPFPPVIWVTACYLEKPCRPRDVSCSCDDAGSAQVERTRIRDAFEIKLFDQRPQCVCSCEPPAKPSPTSGRSCCPEHGAETPAPTTTSAPTLEEARRTTNADGNTEETFDCYQDHMDGVCACDCGCCCVLIGKLAITTAKGDGGTIDQIDVQDIDVRRIRPMLIGQVRHKLQKASSTTTPA